MRKSPTTISITSDLLTSSLAIDEKRAPFSPTLWSLPPTNTKTLLKQVWFPGVHASSGAGDRNHGLSNITIAWMAQQITQYTSLELNMQYLRNMRERGENSLGQPWACAPWENSYKGIYHFSGAAKRKPGLYGKYFPEGNVTNEFIHRSVYERMNNKEANYNPPDLSHLKEDEFGDVEEKLRW